MAKGDGVIEKYTTYLRTLGNCFNTFSSSLAYQTILHPSLSLNKHLAILILIAIRKQLTNEVTSWPSGDIDATYDVCSHQTLEIQIGVCCKRVATANSCRPGSTSRVSFVRSFLEQLGGGDPVASQEKPAHPHLLLKPAAL